MQFIDLATQQLRIRDNIQRRFEQILDHGRYVMGPEIDELENALAAFAQCRHAVSCASGTDALIMALMAKGVGPGDAVITTPFTFVATAEAVQLLGATPVFVDIQPDTFNIDPIQVQAAIDAWKDDAGGIFSLPRGHANLKLRGIISVDIFGQPADFDALNAMAVDNGLFLINDAAQSFGASYGSKKAGILGDIGCTSFFPAKPLGCYGDGGMCFTDDDAIAEKLKSVRVHGQGRDKYENVRTGINGRMDTIQAAIVSEKFKIFPDEIERRNTAAERYAHLLSGNPRVAAPKIGDGRTSVWAQYAILADTPGLKTSILDILGRNGIPTAVYYPIPLHLQKAFFDLGYVKGDLPLCEDASERIFSIPMHPYLEAADQERICNIINSLA